VRYKARRLFDVNDYHRVPKHAFVAVERIGQEVEADLLALWEPEEVSKVHVSDSETRRACRDLVEGLTGRRRLLAGGPAVVAIGPLELAAVLAWYSRRQVKEEFSEVHRDGCIVGRAVRLAIASGVPSGIGPSSISSCTCVCWSRSTVLMTWTLSTNRHIARSVKDMPAILMTCILEGGSTLVEHWRPALDVRTRSEQITSRHSQTFPDWCLR